MAQSHSGQVRTTKNNPRVCRKNLRLWIMILLLGCIPFLSPVTLAVANTLQTDTPTPATTSETETTPAPPVFPIAAQFVQPAWGVPGYEIPLALTSNDHFYFSRPLSIRTDHKITTDYRYGYYYPEADVTHTGIDISGTRGEPVFAAAGGKVFFTGIGLLYGANDKEDPYGLAVMIRHDFSFNGYTLYTVYAHLDKITVSKGDWVDAGSKIGVVGMTGSTSGPHLHFEVRIENALGNKVQNPELWLAPTAGHGVLVGRVETTNGVLMSSKNLWLKSLETGKNWTIVTYAPRIKEVDDYYQENFSVGELPAGNYEISTYYNYKFYKTTIFISPGAVNYVKFHGTAGFSTNLPQISESDFLKPVQ